MVNGHDIDYAPAAPHPLTGRFAPASVELPPHDGRPVLLAGAAAVREAATGLADRVRVLPHGGPDALLIRPDGYVAWSTSDGEAAGLPEALAEWFGPASPGFSPPGW